jgi:3-hydroxyisobutyrate dehydrogenase-like beta-hydroxyacid dehydrogenase
MLDIRTSHGAGHLASDHMEQVAVLGLGHMGTPMARRLVETGHRVTVWNRTQRVGAVPGATVAESAADAVGSADVVITMLTDGGAVESVLFGQSGAAPALRSGTTLVEMSTIGPDALRSITRRLPAGVDIVDAPVAGSTGAAASGSLTILAGGTDEAVARVEPVLAALGTVRRCGGPGEGAALKLVLNTALVTALTSLADVLAVAEALGVDRASALDLLANGPLGIAVQRATAGVGHFAISLAVKDLDLALAGADRAGDLPLAEAAGARLRSVIADGRGEDDIAGLIAAGLIAEGKRS